MQLRLTGDMKGLPEKYKPPCTPLEPVDTGNVCHIKVSRANDPKPFSDAGNIRILSPHQTAPHTKLEKLLSPELTKLNLFNRDVQRHISCYEEIYFPKPILPNFIFIQQRLQDPK